MTGKEERITDIDNKKAKGIQTEIAKETKKRRKRESETAKERVTDR